MKMLNFVILLSFVGIVLCVEASQKGYDLNNIPTKTDYEFWIAEVPGRPSGYPRAVFGIFSSKNYTQSLAEPSPFPGPVIKGRVGDTITVKIHNELHDKRVAIHYHGLHMKRTPWMDGVDGITECGTPAGDSFTYRFTLDQPGTYWYHSHSGSQYVDGVLGPLVVYHKNETSDPILLAYNYDHEYILVIMDWFHETSLDLEILYRGPNHVYPDFYAKFPWTHHAILINGEGNFNCNFTDDPCTNLPVEDDGEKVQCLINRIPFFDVCRPNLYPPRVYECTPGGTTRLRFVNTGNNLGLVVWIDGHEMTVVAKDGFDVIPQTLPAIGLAVSQRMDVIVNCSQSSAFNYTINVGIALNYVKGLANVRNLTASAILSYGNDSSVSASPTLTFDEVTNLIYSTFEYQFRPKVENPMALPADECIDINVGLRNTNQTGYAAQEWLLDGNAYAPSTMPFLQADFLGINFSDIKRYETVDHPAGTFTRSSKVIDLEYGKVYQITFHSGGPAPHPLHIHGYWVNFTDFTTSERVGCDKSAKTILAIGDSFNVPVGGSITFRFNATNVGPWFFHCHIEWHMRLGMALMFNVHDKGTYQGHIDPPPADGKPCLNYDYLNTTRHPTPPPTLSPNPPNNFVQESLSNQPGFIGLLIVTILMAAGNVFLVYWVQVFRKRSLSGSAHVPLTSPEELSSSDAVIN